MPKILVTFGDSWPQGAELRTGEMPFGHWLKTHLDCSVWQNFGVGGSSNDHLISQLQNFLLQDLNNVIAVFFLTNPARSIYWSGDMFLPTHNDQLKHQFLYFHEHDQFRTAVDVAALQKMCSGVGIDDYYLAGWIKMTNWLPGTDVGRIYQQGSVTAAHWLGAYQNNGEHVIDVQNNDYIKPNFCHPNQLGHQLIAEKLAEWIKYRQGDKSK